MNDLTTSTRTVTRNVAITLTANEDEVNFNEIFALDDPAVSAQALGMVQVFQKALVLDEENDSLRFNVQKAKEVIDENPEMGIIAFTDQTIEQKTSAVQVMVDKVLEVLNKVLGVTLSDKPKQKLTGAIENAFTGLDEQKDDAWIFWNHEQAHKTTYQYNILFGVKSQDTGLFLYGLPMGMKITVDIDKSKVLFITLKDKESYKVHLQSLSVVELVKQPFTNAPISFAAGTQSIRSHEDATTFISQLKQKKPLEIK
ncbi:hypothetical protein ACWOYR_003846 [Vibrio parahaemolyticus]|nr:hypothetical protein [Vibrio parahaemolyticus]